VGLLVALTAVAFVAAIVVYPLIFDETVMVALPLAV